MPSIYLSLSARSILTYTDQGEIFLRAERMSDTDVIKPCVAVITKAQWDDLWAQFFAHKLTYHKNYDHWCGVETICAKRYKKRPGKCTLFCPPESGEWKGDTDYMQVVNSYTILEVSLEMEHG